MKEMGWKWKKWKRINCNWRGQKRNNDKKQHANVEEEKLTGKKTSKAKILKRVQICKKSQKFTLKNHMKSPIKLNSMYNLTLNVMVEASYLYLLLPHFFLLLPT